MASRHVDAYFSEGMIKAVQQLPNKYTDSKESFKFQRRLIHFYSVSIGEPWGRGVQKFGGWGKCYNWNMGGNLRGWGEIKLQSY